LYSLSVPSVIGAARVSSGKAMAEKQQQLTLGYWDLRGLGQAIRLLLKYVQADFENKEYTEPDAWFANKFALGFDFPNVRPCEMQYA